MVHAPESLLRPLRAARQYWQLPAVAREEGRRDRRGLPKEDPGIDQWWMPALHGSRTRRTVQPRTMVERPVTSVF
jgi:hypothetical protein